MIGKLLCLVGIHDLEWRCFKATNTVYWKCCRKDCRKDCGKVFD